MEKIASYRTADGRLFDNKAEASAHESALDFIAALKTEFEPTFKAAPEVARLAKAMLSNPDLVIVALQKYKRKTRTVAQAA